MKKSYSFYMVIGTLIATMLILTGMKYPAPLYSPGDVTEKHSKLRCSDCHAPFKRAPSESCSVSNCHIVGKTGKKDAVKDLHNRVKGRDCLVCHTDHKGLKGKITIAFDHRDLPQKVRCADCHITDGEKAHKDKYGDQCQACHTTKNWKAVTFSHEKVTQTACVDCHRPDDDKAHKGKYGDKCQSCHGTKDWKKVSFSHENVTQTACVDCHKGPKDELHLSSGDDCKACHGTKAWKPAKLDHDRFFPLDKEHMVACNKCHESAKNYKVYTCMNCHVHATRGIIKEHAEEGIRNYSDCLRCHRVYMLGRTYGTDRTGENESMIDDDDHKYRGNERRRDHDDDDDDRKGLFKKWFGDDD
ncbi:MAG: cytochrome c3 family protein [bacterium]|nr:cytochrome c3 family protein [bacterium]